MGMLATLVAFGVGYAAGMKIGDKPVRAVRSAAVEARMRASTLVGTAGSIRSRAMRIGMGSTIDVRNVREVMSALPETVTPETTLAEAAMTMKRADIGDVLVVDATRQLRGIVTDRDIAVRAVAEGRDPVSTPVGEAMTTTVQTISPAATAQEAIDLMRRHDVRRLPVVEGGMPIGIVSLGDLATSWKARAALADISAAPPNK